MRPGDLLGAGRTIPGMEDVMPQLKVNGAELYYEVCGGGPPVLLIMASPATPGTSRHLPARSPASSRSSAMTGGGTAEVPARPGGQ